MFSSPNQSAASLMLFPILLFHDSMNFWNTYSGMPCSSVFTALLMTSTTSKPVPIIKFFLSKKKLFFLSKRSEEVLLIFFRVFGNFKNA